AVEMAVRARQVDELKDAERLPLFGQRREIADPLAIHGNDLARLDLADEARADDVERAGFRRNDRGGAVERGQAERPDAVRIAESVELMRREDDDGVGALDPGHGRLDRLE